MRRATLLLAVLAAMLAPTPAPAGESLGVSSQKPADGRFVEWDGKYLVPHTVTIPGTKVSFAMEPIPGGDSFGPFWMGRCEVTWAEYKQYMNLCSVFERFDRQKVRPLTDDRRVDGITAPSKLYDPSFTYMSGEAPELPAVTMTQYAARQYTKWLSLVSDQFYRLPSDTEWEHACRAGTSTAYSFGDDASLIEDYGWHEDNADWETQPVAQKKPNPWGLYDMHGNACEWVLDAHDGKAEDPDGAGGEPPVAWPTELFPRTLRGGSVLFQPAELTSAARRPSDDDEWKAYDPNVPFSPWWFASDEAQDVGFRIVRPVHTPDRQRRERYWQADLPRTEEIADIRILREGRGKRGYVDPELPEAIKSLSGGK